MNTTINKTLYIPFCFILILLLGYSHRSFAALDDLEYFKQFLYQDILDDSDPDFPKHSYRWLMSKYGTRIPLDQDHEMEPIISLFLLENGKYKLVYDEAIFDKKNPTQFVSGICKVIEGHWDVPDKLLVLDKLASADRFIVHDQNAALIKFNDNIGKPVLKDFPIPMSLGFSNYDISQAKCMFGK